MKVYHLNDVCVENRNMHFAIRAKGDKPEVVKAWCDGKYSLVAEVDEVAGDAITNLEVAFEKTNHIHRDWQSNEGVKAVPGGQRSTSVGDIAEYAGELYLCAPVGWQKLDVAVAA